MLFQLVLFLCLPTIFPALCSSIHQCAPVDILLQLILEITKYPSYSPSIQTICKGSEKGKVQTVSAPSSSEKSGAWDRVSEHPMMLRHKPTAELLDARKLMLFQLVLFLCLPIISFCYCSWCWMLFASYLLSYCNGSRLVSTCCSYSWCWLELLYFLVIG